MKLVSNVENGATFDLLRHTLSGHSAKDFVARDAQFPAPLKLDFLILLLTSATYHSTRNAAVYDGVRADFHKAKYNVQKEGAYTSITKKDQVEEPKGMHSVSDEIMENIEAPSFV